MKPPILCKCPTKSVCPILTAVKEFILGMAAKMFTIAGLVIVYGTIALRNN